MKNRLSAPVPRSPADRQMSDNWFKAMSRGWLLAVATVAALAFCLKTAIVLKTIGTNDVLSWEWFLAGIRKSGALSLYHSTEVGLFNHPPFMVHLLRGLGLITASTTLPFPFWIRLPGILADLGSLGLVGMILEPRSGQRLAALLLMAASPASVMISGFHGNTDPVMIFFVLLSIFLIERRGSTWLAGVALGMSINMKVWPLVLLPVVFLYYPDAPKRIACFAATGATVLLGSMPYILQEPLVIARRVLGYGSIYGHWGVSRVIDGLVDLTGYFRWPNTFYYHWGKFIVLGTIIAASFWMNRGLKKPPLFLQCGLVAFLFLALTPGFGVQYLAWLVPWVVGLGPWTALLYYATSGIFLFLVYNFWSHGIPWYLADSPKVGSWRGYGIFFELLCWASVLVILLRYMKYVYSLSLQGSARNASGEETRVVE